MLYYQHDIETVAKQLDSSVEGLPPSQAALRLKQNGPNSIRIQSEPLWRKLIAPFASAFMWVLIAAAAVSVFNKELLDAAIVVLVISVSVGIYYVQRFSTERILRALQKHQKQIVEVIRESTMLRIPAENLVVGDVVVLHEGEKVPADLRLVHAESLRCNESILTGEAQPVNKQTHPLSHTKEIYEQTNMLFQSTYIISGQGRGMVVAAGNQTEYGKLAKLSASGQEASPTQQKIDQLLSRIIIAVLVAAGLAFVLALYRGMPTVEALRFIMALAVSAVPEGLPVAISVILVLGMRRMAKRKTLVRSMSAMENIGVITTIATDKTGTLTKNQLTIQKTWSQTNAQLLDQILPLVVIGSGNRFHDPLDAAVMHYMHQKHLKFPAGYRLSTVLPFSLEAAMSGNIWQTKNGLLLAVKGAPEHILRRCKLSTSQLQAAEHQLHSLTSQSFKVIALAKINSKKQIANIEQAPVHGLEFVGFIAVADEIRPSAAQAVASAQAAGITVRMITGDHFETAYSIGKQLGIASHPSQAFDSRQLSKTSDGPLLKLIKDIRVFARVIPEHKFRILQLLKKTEITAMTGDGVNDVPALANAHIGIAMGSGTQMAKEAGDIVLLNNNFKNIVEAVREGRTIFNNIRKMLFYLFATSSGEVITMISALALGLPLPLVAVQILWVNLVTDTILVIPIGLEPGEPHSMQQPPRPPQAPILDRLIISRMIVIALTMAALTIATFHYFLGFTTVAYAQTIAFSLLVVMQWANALNARSEWQSVVQQLRRRNSKFYLALSLAVGLQLLALFGPLRTTLHVIPVQLSHLIWSGLIGLIVIIGICELHKSASRWWRVRQNRVITALKLQAPKRP